MKTIIVCGPPASGKTTYVKQHMIPGDIVVDLDAIIDAISFRQGKEDMPDLLPVALGIRNYLYRVIDCSEVRSVHAWVIACLPTQKERDDLVERFDAELIHLDVPKEECLKRAAYDGDCSRISLQVRIIEKYFEKVRRDGR